jgi:glycosyltransferase involved in cell wall biosynthesis
MKIGIILHPYGEDKPGGLPRIIFGWAEALIQTHPENEYIIFLKHKPSKPIPLPQANLKVHVLGEGRLWLNRLCRAPQADVYLFNTPVLPLFWKPRRSVVIALDYPYKYLQAKDWRESLWRIFIGFYHKYSLKRADHIIAVSDSTKNDTVKFFGIPKQKITTVYHGYKAVCKLPKEHVNLPDKFFFFAGTMKERKNVRAIVDAYILFSRQISGYKLVLAGKNEGDYYESLKTYIVSSNMKDDIIFTGHLSENQLSEAYSRAYALVFPSIVEGTGFPILEAMSCRVPVITSNIFGPAELGGDGAALLVDPHNPDAIAGAMIELVNTPGLKDKLIEQGLERLKKFNWRNTGRQTYEILVSI